ncbi:MAG: ATP-binding protein [Pseudomonadota bacterium]
MDLPADQTVKMPPASAPIQRPPASRIVLAAAACVALSFLLPAGQFKIVLALCGAILSCLAFLIVVLNWTAWRAEARLCGVAARLVTAYTKPALITDPQGRATFANAGAIERFGAVAGKPLSQIFGRMLANPDAILANLLASIGNEGAAADDIVTRRGHFRLQAVEIGKGCHLWTLEDADLAARSGAPGVSAGELAIVHVDDNDHVTFATPALVRLLGQAPKTLADVFVDLPVQSGALQEVRGSAGSERCLVVVLSARESQRQICVLPGVDIAQPPPTIDTDWAMIEDLPVPLLKIAHDGQLIGSTHEARQLLHIETTQGRRLADVLDGPGRPINDWLQEALAGKVGHVSQFLRGRGESEDTFVQVTLSSALGHDEDPHLIAVLNDVTELKTLEAQFVQSQKMQAIGQLAGGVAHDFNNLLTAISGHCDLLLLHHDEDDQNYNDLIQIHQNANRAASLVGQLLAFSRKQNLRMETTDLRDTLSDLTHLLNRLVGEKVRLTLDHDPGLAKIKADKRQLEQVLMNLVVNARDAMDGAGEIKVVTENRKLEKEFVHGRATVPPGDYVVVKVIDEGHGIPPEKLPKIFEPFWTTKTTGEGTGLGLSTAYGIVKQTGGFIFAESEVGKGTTFSLMFPQHQHTTVAPIPMAPMAPDIIHARTDGVVLLVEDEAPVRAFASRALRLRGYTVLKADCAESALELLEDPDLKVDLFVSDVIMPGLDGPTWVRQALKDRPGTGVLFVSGYPEDAFDDGEAQIPDAVFLPKPFSLKALTHTVESQLQKRLVDA